MAYFNVVLECEEVNFCGRVLDQLPGARDKKALNPLVLHNDDQKHILCFVNWRLKRTDELLFKPLKCNQELTSPFGEVL